VVAGVAEDFTNEWAYTALSRGRDPVHVHLTAERDDRSDRSEIAPSPPERTVEEAIERTSPPSDLGLERVALRVLDRVDREVDIEVRASRGGRAAGVRLAGSPPPAPA